MAKRSGAVHVATTRRRYKGRLYETNLLRRSYREGGKVKHQTLGNLSHLPPDLIETIRGRLRGDLPPGTGSGGFQILRSFPHGHVAAVLGTLRQLGLERLLGSRASEERSLVLALIVARIIEPRSKLATASALMQQSATSSLAVELGIQLDDERRLYQAMDWLRARQGRIEEALAGRHLGEGSLVLYDVSSSFYTGSHCALAKFGHSRDGRAGYPQIVYGLLCNSEGCPVAIEVFEGNTADPTTLPAQVDKIRNRFHIERLVLVGDRGMITSKRIEKTLRGVPGLEWISALRADNIKKLVEQGSIELSLFDDRDLLEVSSPDYPGERLIVCRNPLLAHERARKRQELLEATERLLEPIVAATRRPKRPLRGKETIGLRVGKLINHYKVGKHFLLEITEESFAYRRDEQRIAAEASLDGLYVIRTSVASESLSAERTVGAYKELSKVERAFRSLKTVDLKVRPIYHWLEDRVRAHVFLCMLAYYVEWHMRQALAPMLFDDEEPEQALALRSSIVAPAERSPKALHKAATGLTTDGLPVHSFRTLLQDLATLTLNRLRLGDQSLERISLPTPVQERAFQLLKVSPLF
jgi:hypothetical protein